MMDYLWSTGYGFGAFGMLFMILFWGAIIWLIIWAVQQFTKSKESATEILEKRLARGDISRKEYTALRKELRR